MAKTLRNKIADVNKHKFVEATLIDAVGSLCSVKIGGKRGNGGVLRGIPFVGPAGDFGQKVYVDYSSGKPIVYIYGKPQEEAQTPRPIVQRPTNAEPPSETGTEGGGGAITASSGILLTGVTEDTLFDATDTGLAEAIAAAQDGDSIYVPDGDYNGPFTLPHGVNLIGSTDTTIQYKVTTGGDNIFRNVNFWQTIVPNEFNVEIPDANDNVFFYNCKFYCGMGTADIYNVKLGHGGNVIAEFWNCHFEVYASDHNARAFYSTVAHGSPSQPWTKLFYCYFNVRYVGGSHTAELWNSNCKLGTYGCSWLDGLDPGANVFWIDGDRTASSASDPTAIHTDGANEISGLTEKESPVDADLLLIEDSAAGYVKKKTLISNLPFSSSADAITVSTASFGGALSAADDTVQKALDTLDEAAGGGAFSNIVWTIEGMLEAQANALPAMLVTRASTIERVTIYAKNPGSVGTTTFDVNKNGASIFVTPPSIAYNDPDNKVIVVPDTTAVSANDVFTLDIDAAATDAQDFTVSVEFGAYLGAGADPYAIHDNVAAEITAIAEKTVPVDDDTILIEDSEDDDNKKSVKIVNLPFTASSIGQEKIFTREGTLTATSGTVRIANHSGSTRTIIGVYLDANTAPTGAAIIVDIHKNGTTIFTTQSNRPQIAIGANSGNSTTIEVATWSDGQYLTCDVDQIGSVVEGKDLTATIVYRQ